MEKQEMIPYVRSIVAQLCRSHRLTGTYIIRFESLRRIPDSDMEDIISVYAIPVDEADVEKPSKFYPHIEILSGTLPPGLIGYDFEITISSQPQPNTAPKIEINTQNIQLSTQ